MYPKWSLFMLFLLIDLALVALLISWRKKPLPSQPPLPTKMATTSRTTPISGPLIKKQEEITHSIHTIYPRDY
jgi:hypothetical protein